jgi:hypothetical protein
MTIKNGEFANADEVMNAFGIFFKNFAQLNWNEAYDQGGDITSWNAKLNADGVPQFKNLVTDTFQTESATSDGFQYNSANDYYETVDVSVATVGSEYVIIEADDANVSWSNNDCVLEKMGTGKWLLYCDTGTTAVKRAQIIKSLFFGTDGSDQLVLDFANVTAMKTSHANDVGKRAHYAQMSYGWLATGGDTGIEFARYTGTFADTSTNTDCSSWSNFFSNFNIGAPKQIAAWELPEGTDIHTLTTGTGQSTATSDEIGTDTSADETDNPADCELQIEGRRFASGWYGADSWLIVLCAGDISWAYTEDSASVKTASSNIDFFSDNSIPDFTAASSLATEFGTATLIIKDTASATVTNSISTWNATIDAGDVLVVSISYDGGANYTVVTDPTIARATPTGTGLWLKFTLTRNDLTKTNLITEAATSYNWY